MSSPFELGLLDYYGNVGIAENGGSCTVQYPLTDNITVPDLGRSSTITAGLAAFDVFSIIGADSQLESPCHRVRGHMQLAWHVALTQDAACCLAEHLMQNSYMLPLLMITSSALCLWAANHQ